MKSDKIYYLSNFTGPIELLLFLIQREELDIAEVSLKKLTEQGQIDDLDEGGFFISTMAKLLAYKIRRLTKEKKSETPEVEISPDLFEYLIEYERVKAQASELDDFQSKEEGCYSREVEYSSLPPAKLEGVSLEELGLLFDALISRFEKKSGVILEEKWTLQPKIEWLKEILSHEKKILFTKLFVDAEAKGEMIVIFLALLELMKRREVTICRIEEEIFVYYE